MRPRLAESSFLRKQEPSHCLLDSRLRGNDAGLGVSGFELLDITLPSPQENLEFDNKLLDETDAGRRPPTLRFWEPAEHFVVLGYSSRLEEDVDVAECKRLGIPILRRTSGGGTVLLGPGCLNYSLTLSIPESGPLRGISSTACFILERLRNALQPLISGKITIEGTGDLALCIPSPPAGEGADGGAGQTPRKFSGNAQRRKRRALLFHGTLLYNFDIPLVQRLLPIPVRQPAYRSRRSHDDFLDNLPQSATSLMNTIRSAWILDL